MNKTNILIVDSHHLYIDGIKMNLQNHKNINVVADVKDENKAKRYLKENNVHLVITDIGLIQENEDNLLSFLKESTSEIKILLTFYPNKCHKLNNSLFNDADGLLLRDVSRKEFLNAISEILKGNTFYSKEALDFLVQKFKNDNKKSEAVKLLSSREHEILNLICQEYTSEQIANKLFISRRTVDTHRQHIIGKIGVKTIVGLVKFAIKNAIIEV